MTIVSLVRRSLAHHWRASAAVTLGVVAGSATLSGALLVGDSLRGSLRDSALRRLQRVDAVFQASRPFRESLARDLRDATAGREPNAIISAAWFLRGSAVHAESMARANRVDVIGVDAEFWRFGSDGAPMPPGFEPGAVALNEALAGSLEARVGDDVLLRFERLSEISAETLMGNRDDRSVTIRATVCAVLPDSGLGGFSLTPRQRRPLSAFVPITVLQRAVGVSDRAGAILLAGMDSPTAVDDPTRSPADRVTSMLRLEDFGLTLRKAAHGQAITIESSAGFLPPPAEAASRAAAVDLNTSSSGVLSYLANEIRVAGQAGSGTPYSTVAAVEAGSRLAAELASAAGLDHASLRPGDILLNRWVADDCGASIGDPIELVFYRTGDFGSLETHTAPFRMRAIVPLAGAAADPRLVPEYRGITDTRHIADWDPPFPIDLKRIRPRDEEYWDEHRATPKAFITLDDGRRLWVQHEDRFGRLTSLLVFPPPSMSIDELESRLTERIRARIDPAAMGFRYDPLRARAVTASRGTTDFGALFVGFSSFLIVAAALLVALLFRLGVERRAAECGTLLAIGFPPQRVLWALIAEGACLAAVGCVLGSLTALGYAGLMLSGLRTQWSAAVNAPFLELHVSLASLALGGGVSFGIAIASIAAACRGLTRLPARTLMAGRTAGPDAKRLRQHRAWWVLGCLVLLSVACLVAAAGGAIPPSAGFFCGGALLLAAAVLGVRLWLVCEPRSMIHRPGTRAIGRLALRSAARAPGRSVSIVSLLAAATFVIVAIGAFRVEPDDNVDDRRGGTGGFSLYAESATPLVLDLNSRTGRDRLGLIAPGPPDAPDVLERVDFVPFRLRPGDDASCLNLYQRMTPRILGAPGSMLARGGFRFAGSIAPPGGAAAASSANPWRILDSTLPDGAIPAIGDEAAVRWQLHSGLGRDFEIQDERGRPVRLRFVALLAGSALQDELIVSEANFTRLFPSSVGYSFFLIDTTRATRVATAAPVASTADAGPAASPAESVRREVERRLERGLSDFGFDVAATRDRLRDYLAVQNTYLSTFQLLGGVGLILGSLGLTATLLRAVWERRRELALCRALGYPPAAVMRLIWIEYGALCLTGLVCGMVPAALAIAPTALQRAVTVPWGTISLTLAGVVSVAAVSAAAAVRPLRTSPLLPALRGE